LKDTITKVDKKDRSYKEKIIYKYKRKRKKVSDGVGGKSPKGAGKRSPIDRRAGDVFRFVGVVSIAQAGISTG
jgi:hypothetical protein